MREFVRTVAELRAKAGFRPSDKIVLCAELPEELRTMILRNEKNILKETGAESAEYKRREKLSAEMETKIDEYPVWLGVKKA